MLLKLLIGGEDEAISAYVAESFDLGVQPLRPGIAHEVVALRLSADQAHAVETAAAAEGLPAGLWAAIVVESERALRAAAEALDSTHRAVEAALDATAAQCVTAMPGQRARRLAAYARALRRAAPRTPRSVRGRLDVTVTYHTLVAWERDAASAGVALPAWVMGLLIVMPPGRPRWEAAAADAGQTLGEWVTLQAARRSSS